MYRYLNKKKLKKIFCLNLCSNRYFINNNFIRHVLLAPIGNFLKIILGKYLNEIRMPIEIPLKIDLFNSNNESDENDSNTRIFNALRDKIKSNSTISDRGSNETATNFTYNDSNLDISSSLNFFESQAKVDIYKTIYDYFFFTVLNKYYLFYFDQMDESNKYECQSINSKRLKAKSNFNYFKLSQLSTNEQYKSILNMKCYKFISADFVMND